MWFYDCKYNRVGGATCDFHTYNNLSNAKTADPLSGTCRVFFRRNLIKRGTVRRLPSRESNPPSFSVVSI